MLDPQSWINVYMLTFNCARNTIDTQTFASHLFDGLSMDSGTVQYPEIVVLSLQEIAPIAYAFLGGPFLEWYYDAFRLAVDLATPEDQRYQNILTKNVGLTAIMIFVRDDVVDRIAWLESAEVGVGVHQAGNKGAVGARLGYRVDWKDKNQLILTFLSLHLAPDEAGVAKRNQDWKDICQRLIFTSDDNTDNNPSPIERRQYDEEGTPLIPGSSNMARYRGIYLPGSYVFVAGDLNYRTASRRPEHHDISAFPLVTDDTGSNSHYMHLLPRDQLAWELRANKTMHHLSEQPVTFPPTYKYSIEARKGSSLHPSQGFKWARNRWPSWCDRILFLDNPFPGAKRYQVKPHHYGILPLFSTSDHRPVVLFASVPIPLHKELSVQVSAISPPYELDPEWQSKRSIARNKELAVGATAYLFLTWEGNGLIMAIVLGLAAGYFALYGLE